MKKVTFSFQKELHEVSNFPSEIFNSNLFAVCKKHGAVIQTLDGQNIGTDKEYLNFKISSLAGTFTQLQKELKSMVDKYYATT